MNKINKKTFVILIILLLLMVSIVAYLIFYNPLGTIYRSSDINVITVDKNNISKISISNTNGKTTLVNTDNIWYFEDDAKLPVLQSKAMGIAYDVATVYALEKVEDNARDLAMYGLSPAVATVTVTMTDGNSYSILTGNRLEDNSGFYLKTGDKNTVYIVDIGKGQNFKSSKQEFVDYDLSNISRENINSVTLCNNSNEQIVVERYSIVDGIVEWVMTYPTKWPVSSSEFESKILYPVINLKAEKFIVDDKFDNEKFIKDNFAYVGVTDNDGNSKFFRLGKSSGNKVNLYADGQNYLANLTSKISIVSEIVPITIMSEKLDFEFLGTDVKVEGFINGEKIDDVDKYDFSVLKIDEQLETKDYVKTNQYLKFYNNNDEICYSLYECDNEKYAVSTDGNAYFSLKKSTANQFTDTKLK